MSGKSDTRKMKNAKRMHKNTDDDYVPYEFPKNIQRIKQSNMRYDPMKIITKEDLLQKDTMEAEPDNFRADNYISMDSEGYIEQYDQTINKEFENSYQSNDMTNSYEPYKKKMSRFQKKKDIYIEPVELPDSLYPIAHTFHIEHSNDVLNILSKELVPIMTEGVDYPLFQYGFYHWLHASKNKTEVFDTFKNKKRVYYVVSGYERYIDEYKEAIGNQMDQYYVVQSKEPKILSRAFYKLWEILSMKRLIDTKEKNFRSAHLAEGPGSFIQATMFYRKLFSKHAHDDRYYAITIHSENEDSVPELEREFVEYYKKEKQQRFFMHQTFPRKEARASQTKDNGDLTMSKTIRNFKKDVGEPVDFVTADGGFDWNNENIQEQEAGTLMLAQITTAIAVQKKGGCFVLKMFENFTKLSAKLLLLLSIIYKDIDIIKPLTSRESNSERYIVCTDFKLDRKQSDDLLEKMYTALDQIKQYADLNQGKSYLLDIYPDIEVSAEQIEQMVVINTQIANRQFMVINRMISYIEGSNYHGELYQRYRDRQIKLAKHWIDIFVEKKTEDQLVEASTVLLKNGIGDSNSLFKKLYGKVERKHKPPVDEIKNISTEKKIETKVKRQSTEKKIEKKVTRQSTEKKTKTTEKKTKSTEKKTKSTEKKTKTSGKKTKTSGKKTKSTEKKTKSTGKKKQI